jgi:hypothetical protein
MWAPSPLGQASVGQPWPGPDEWAAVRAAGGWHALKGRFERDQS